MGIVEAYSAFWRNWNDVKGRATRSEYWWGMTADIIMLLLLLILDVILGTVIVLFIVYLLLSFIPRITLSVRRLHDFNWSGWWYLLVLIPGASFIVFIIIGVIPGNEESNAYGHSKLPVNERTL